MVMKSQGIERARDLARAYCQKAMDAISRLPATDAREALVQLTNVVLTRNK
jgi:hexaprenyl-diphosphate synthase